MASRTPTPVSFDFQAVLDIITSTDASSSAPSTASTTSISGSPPAPSSSTSQPIDTPPSTPLPVSLASTTSTPVGAIAGGIIGALVFIALVGVGIWYMVRRRRANHMAPSAAYKAAVRAGHQSPMPYQPVYHDSPRHSSEDLPETHDGGAYPFLQTPSRPVSIHSESRFREHTTT
ncbi:hypothetical protein B0H14DRAFT_3420867 [Mycena olivaceomarginata]|nr:hypothetical protein B0H14DRAFT_3420867 [Mycena olivaceomarginata]